MGRVNFQPSDTPGIVKLGGGTYDLKDIIKAAGGRWSANAKTWTISEHLVADLAYRLRREGHSAAGYKVPPTNATPAHVAVSKVWTDHLVAAMLNVGGPELALAALTSLIRVVHPDVGGSTVLAQQVNVARDRVRQMTK